MSREHRPIRVTPTYAGPDSKGVVSVFGWDLEGMVAFYLVVGALLGMLVLFSTAGKPLLARLAFSLVPVLVAALWVRIFVHGRPPSYQSDVFERWLRGTTFRLRPQKWCRRRHPRGLVAQRLHDQMERCHG
jgi:hypothetical protein